MRVSAIEKQMRHLNSNSLCAITIETTSDDTRKGDIVEICAMLVDNFIKPSAAHPPFYLQIAPFRPEAIDFETATISRARMQEAMTHGVEPSLAADRFETWIKDIGMPENKKIVPLVYNWPVMHDYFHTWLGFHNFKYLISHEYRDIMSAVLFINDRYNQRADLIPFPRPEHFPYIAALNDVSVRMSDDVMVRCLKLIEVYRLLLGRRC